MTKTDMKYLLGGTAVGVGLFVFIWWAARKNLSIPVINPSLVKWDNGTSA